MTRGNVIFVFVFVSMSSRPAPHCRRCKIGLETPDWNRPNPATLPEPSAETQSELKEEDPTRPHEVGVSEYRRWPAARVEALPRSAQ